MGEIRDSQNTSSPVIKWRLLAVILGLVITVILGKILFFINMSVNCKRQTCNIATFFKVIVVNKHSNQAKFFMLT